MQILFIGLLLFSLPAFSTERGDNYEALTPREKQLLENGLAESTFPSLCPRTREFAEKARWEHDPITTKTDFVLVDKKRRLIHLLNREQVLATYQMALGGNPVGHKSMEGDQKTPEGVYFIDLKNRKSDFHLSLRISYPNTRDIEEALRRGIRDPGKDIMIHGLPNSWIKRKLIRHPRDWTKGCMAVTSDEVEEIFSSVDLGSVVEICP